MNMRLAKRILATTMAAALMVAPVITAGATTDTSSGSSDTTATSSEETTVEDTSVTPTSTVAVGGTVIKSQISGAYAIEKTSNVAGVAVRQGDDAIKAAAGLGKNEKPFARVYTISAKKSPAAFVSFEAAASSVGGTILGAVNFDLGKMTAGKFSDLPAGVSVPVTFGVKNANGRTLAVVKVLPGGVTEILQDTDDNPNTVTVPVTGGIAAYAIIAY